MNQNTMETTPDESKQGTPPPPHPHPTPASGSACLRDKLVLEFVALLGRKGVPAKLDHVLEDVVGKVADHRRVVEVGQRHQVRDRVHKRFLKSAGNFIT